MYKIYNRTVLSLANIIESIEKLERDCVYT